ncbi:MAG: transposase, partial [Candidatus Dojkabacteria bacterium]
MGKINKEVQLEILSKVKAGIPVKKLTEQYGVSYQTIYSWLKKSTTGPTQAELNRYKKENAQLKEL